MEEISWLSSTWAFTAAYFGAVGGVITFFYSVFQSADDSLKPAKRAFLANKLTGLQKGNPGDWVTDFTQVFDRFFGENHFSLKCISRSFLISATAFSISAFSLMYLDNSYSLIDDIEKSEALFFIFLISVFFNGIPDYLSLLETRLLLKLKLPISFRIILDIFFTNIILLLWILTLANFGLGGPVELSSLSNLFDFIKNDLLNFNTSNSRIVAMTIYLTTFTTSIWLWLHGVSQLTIKALSGTAKLSRWLNVKDKPLQSIATVINIYILLLSIIIYFILLANR